ncbi:ammonium transporter [Paeniglutamicibacter cryotolerans]|uniref:Ammonium transporter n=1 Tax=Paeniglutamicibacter cryotolerans TaxID=670079 RepID=A0A839QTV1_9MICC|nr:ammonium transporter [Paeniglutamicibacter cryotolerans]MBB2997396.1 Amt family ammonium transporter [Paeniglutamicibacter cryotolerans]
MELTSSQVWMMVCAALVLLMTPALAFFYGGMTRAKSVLNMMMMSFSAIALVAVVWVLWGYSMSGGGEGLGGIIGNPMGDIGLVAQLGTDQMIAVGLGATFAIITVALISGAIADRAKFGAWMLFVPIWVTLVYAPLAHWVWGGGLLGPVGLIGSWAGEAIDFAGGTVVHINAGVAGLVLALIVGKRRGFGKDPSQRPHNIPFVMLGAALLWFGWFGFNGGASSTVEEAGLIWVKTLVAPAAALLGWILVERMRDGHGTSLGAASGIVAGLVAITPACANITPSAAIGLGLVAGVVSALAVGLKYRWGYDDSLDVVGVHLVSGIIGTLALGLIALPAEGTAGGLLYGGGWGQMRAQVVATLVTVVFTGIMTTIIGLAIHRTVGFRVSEEEEIAGIDLMQHAETGYEFGGLGTGGTFVPHPATSGHLKTEEEVSA